MSEQHAMQSDAERNSFLLLELDPAVCDQNIIDDAIRLKQRQWSKQAMDHPNQAVKSRARFCLEQLDMIRQTMQDQVARDDEAKKALDKIRQLRTEHAGAFKEAVDLLSRGTVSEQHIEHVAQRFSHAHYSSNDVRAELTRLNDLKESARDSRPGTLRTSTFRVVDEQLALLNAGSLYEILGLGSAASCHRLGDAARARQQDLQAAPPSAFNDTRRALLGHSLVIFSNETRRREYDAWLLGKKMRPVTVLIHHLLPGTRLNLAQLLQLIGRGMQYELSIAELLPVIFRTARSNKIMIDVSVTVDFTKRRRCACGQLNSPLDENCESCAGALFLSCPDCRKWIAMDTRQCECGYDLRSAFETLKTAILRNDIPAFTSAWRSSLAEHSAFKPLLIAFEQQSTEHRGEADRALEVARRSTAVLQGLEQKNQQMIRSNWAPELVKFSSELECRLGEIETAFIPEPPGELRAVHYGDYVQVQWSLETPADYYRICWDAGQYVRDEDSGSSIELSRADYLRNGCKFPAVTRHKLYVSVFAVNQFMGRMLYSNGDNDSARTIASYTPKMLIRYRILKQRRFNGQQLTLELYTDERQIESPALCLIGTSESLLPPDPKSGTMMRSIEPLILQRHQPRRIEIRSTDDSLQIYRLFCADPAREATTILVPYSTNAIR